MFRATTACTFSTSELPNVVRTCSPFNILTWTCALRHNGVHLFDILTSKSGLNVVCFVQTCDSRHNGVHFFDISTSKSGLNMWCVLCILTWKCASRHNGVQLFISHLASWLRTRRFSKPTFRPPRATNHWKNSESRLSYLFAHLHLLSSHSFSSLLFSLLGFSSLTLPTSAFPSVHIVRSLTSKLPSIMIWYIYIYPPINPN